MGKADTLSVDKVSVLLVDDEKTSRITMRALLKNLQGVACLTAANGAEALAKAEEREFAAIVLDVVMPDMNGFEVAQRLRACARNAHTPIIFATAVEKDEDAVFKGYEQGAVDYLSKPVDARIFVPKVAKFVDIFREQRAMGASLEEARQRVVDVGALLQAAESVLWIEDFPTTARKVFDAAKRAIGARAGYVALLSPDGAENEVLFLDTGGRSCDVNPELPMPIRGLRAEAYDKASTVYDNNFSSSRWMDFMPEGHVSLDNVLFAPLNVEGRMKGVMGLANKGEDFTPEDAQLASAFANFAAVALRNSRNMDKLTESRHCLLRAQKQAGMGSFVRNPGTGAMEWSEGMYALFDLDMEHDGAAPSLSRLPEEFRSQMERLLEQAGVSGHPVDAEITFHLPNGGERTLLLQVDPERNEHGAASRLHGTLLDLTRQKTMMRRLFATHRLEAVGQLAGGVAHEINTPVQYIMSNIDFFDMFLRAVATLYQDLESLTLRNEVHPLTRALKEVLRRSRMDAYLEESSEALSDMRDGLARVSSIISTMRQLVPMAKEKRCPTDINAVIRDLVTITSQEWQPVADLMLDLAPKLPLVIASKSELGQALLNIFMNAIQAVKQIRGETATKGVIRLCTREESGKVVISITDSGPGISGEIRERIFDPFFTTKEIGTATGQGLSLAHFIVQGHNGTIDFTSKPDAGATFFIRLPVMDREQ